MVDLTIPSSNSKKKENKMRTDRTPEMTAFFQKHGEDASKWTAETLVEFGAITTKKPDANAEDKKEYRAICEDLELTPSDAFKSFITLSSKKSKDDPDEKIIRTEVAVTFTRNGATNRIATYISSKIKGDALTSAIKDAKIQAVKDFHKVIA